RRSPQTRPTPDPYSAGEVVPVQSAFWVVWNWQPSALIQFVQRVVFFSRLVWNTPLADGGTVGAAAVDLEEPSQGGNVGRIAHHRGHLTAHIQRWLGKGYAADGRHGVVHQEHLAMRNQAGDRALAQHLDLDTGR